jgi:nicotinate-nucleotide--dimethylbenzimidazole phosphoribosyltransferase
MKLVLSGLGKLEHMPQAHFEETERPGWVQAEVLACAICRTDAKMWEQGHRDLVFPRVPGHEMVVRTGDGTRHVVWPGSSCGHCRFCQSGRENLCEEMKITGFHNDGGFASSVLVPEKSLIMLPDSIDNHIGCFAEPVGCVVNAFGKMKLTGDARVLIIGGGTLGLIAALYCQYLGLKPQIIEKHQTKITRIAHFLQTTNVPCDKDTVESEFDIVISCCGDYIGFCQGLAKVVKGGSISFFSGLSKNEHIETNLLNLLHYKEVMVAGAYGLTSRNMVEALPFMEKRAEQLRMLIEEVVQPEDVPRLMSRVLAGTHLKFIIDCAGASASLPHERKAREFIAEQPSALPLSGLCAEVIAAIEPLADSLRADATTKVDNKSKPLGALGRLEPLAIQMSCIQSTLSPEIRNKQLLVFAADHGITEEGVSAYPAEVTGQMVENFLHGGAAINVLCRHHDIGLKIVDMGVNHTFQPHPDLIMGKVAFGTQNCAIQDAMTRDQVQLALENGMRAFFEVEEKAGKIDIIGLGEMGIGNTTSATAIISVVTGISPAEAAGRGTGVDDHGLKHKIEVIEKVLQFHKLNKADGLTILQKVGGFEIAGIAGAVLAAALRKSAVVLDGVISTAAGLIAYLINPAIQGYLIAGHKSVEKSQAAALAYMRLTPVIDLDMRLGEGTGAALAIDLTTAACKIMGEMASFDEAKVARSRPLANMAAKE